MSEEITDVQRARLVISPREVIFKYMRYLPWLVLSIAIMLTGAYIKLRYSTPIFSASGKLQVTTQSPYTNSNEKFDDIFMMQRSEKINDEIEIIKSRSMASRVALSLGLQKQIYNKGKIRSTIIYSKEVPFNFEIISIADSLSGFSVGITFLPDDTYTIDQKPQKHFYNEEIKYGSAIFRITSNNKDPRAFSSNIFVVSWQPIENLSVGLSGGIAVSRVNESTNMLNLSYQSENTKLGVDIVNQYMYEYQRASLEDKKLIAARTLEFIDQQLDTVRHELGSVERNLQNYREQNRIFNTEAQTQMVFGELAESNKEIVKHGVGLEVIDYLSRYLSDKKNENKMISSTLAIEEPSLMEQVSAFNKLQLEREIALQNTPAGNPLILSLDASIDKLRMDMLENLKNIRQTHVLALNELTRRGKDADQLINTIPSKEKKMLEVTRQQNILQELYSYLLQKKLETSIASASTISNIKVIEPALASGIPVSPNKKGTYILAFVLGVAIPAAIIFLVEYLNDKVKSKHEIVQMTDAPILGEIGHAQESGALVVTSKSRKFLAEQFRIVRSNIQYILPKVEKPVILVTSSFSGEGKSFISTNLGAVLALSGKRTVILEFDIRKPKIMKGLGLHERKGITNYIVSNIPLHDLIYPVPEVENLYVIACGPVPPNPSEMLLNERVGQMIRELKLSFDAIIIDTAPVGLVSDAITLGTHADATIYIVRHNYTLKKQIQLIDDIYQKNKLPHLSLIINDIQARGGYGGYYGYGGYGYGYGYGKEGVSYFESNNGKSNGKLKRLFSFKKNK